VLTDIADAVVAELNAETWSMEFEAEVKYLPVEPHEDLASLQVSVLPRGEDLTLDTRRDTIHEYRVPVLIQKRVDWAEGKADPVEMAALLGLCEELSDHFIKLQLDDPSAACMAIEQDPAFIPENLEAHEFAAVLMMTWRLWR